MEFIGLHLNDRKRLVSETLSVKNIMFIQKFLLFNSRKDSLIQQNVLLFSESLN